MKLNRRPYSRIGDQALGDNNMQTVLFSGFDFCVRVFITIVIAYAVAKELSGNLQLVQLVAGMLPRSMHPRPRRDQDVRIPSRDESEAETSNVREETSPRLETS
jgi:hypothetical protein